MNFLIKNLSISFFLINLGKSFEYIGSEESLRQNLKQLFEGKLNFSDDNVPPYKNELEDSTPENQSEYDFIVIGAGTAGAAIAGRLSEVENVTVLLIEAGDKEYPIMGIPLAAFALQSKQINWDYRAESSDKYCLAMENSQCRFARGKVMGGTSVINTMIATRGNKKDYDDWAKITDDESWSYKEMLQYLKKLENFDVNGVKIDWELHNYNGPEPITNILTHNDLAKHFMECGKELGYPTSADYNGKEQIGFSFMQYTIRDGERWSTNRAYLHPAKDRKNLFLTRNSHVNKILINNETKLAYGVEFSKSGKIFYVKAKKEIILSAGAINSPQILMLSGIGPASHLKELNIDVIKDAPVGENLMDHISYTGLLFTTNLSLPKNTSDLLDPNNPAVKDYINDRSGSLVTEIVGQLAYVNVDEPNPLNKNPNIELIFGAGGVGLKNPLFSNALGISKEYLEKLEAITLENLTYHMPTMLMLPKSRGKILLRSKDPNDKPKIYANYLDDPEDVRVLLKGIRFAIQLSKTRTFQKYGAKIIDMPLPNCQKDKYDSDAYWECASRTYTSTVYHYCGTCKMGREDDPTSVVNSKLQVIGIKGLRVIDASIMPIIVSAHTNIPIIAISEKLADVIKKEWNLI